MPNLARTTVVNERPTIATKVIVTDVTGQEGDFRLDEQGFAFVKHSSSMSGFHDESALKAEYFSECEGLLKEL
jgi:hypothetical protein